ncbi:unnamed protein product [Lactuca saligna]|uniref:Uncharacterized protein n=1 Tax=Lactuca saligna TaxID=75948 RepID=A0AA36EDK8_LACSI|nr:unnamed protein product [Lactuca saligna]
MTVVMPTVVAMAVSLVTVSQSIKRLQRLYSRLQQQALTITPSVISSSPSIAPSVISSSPSTMVMCFYRKWAIVWTSWIDNNLRHRFWGCPDTNSSCGLLGGMMNPCVLVPKL